MEEFVPKGTKIWALREDKATIFKTRDQLEEYLSSLSPKKQIETLVHIYCSGNEAILLSDGAQYTNPDFHSNAVNTEDLKSNFTTRDIFPGEEMTNNYTEFHVIDWFEELCRSRSVISCVMFPRLLEKGEIS